MTQNDAEKLLYHILRFSTASYGLESNDGWVNIDSLVYKVNFQHGEDIFDRVLIRKITKDNNRFSINFMRTKIKANIIEGEGQVALKKAIPPDRLFYKTNKPFSYTGKYVILPENGEKLLQLGVNPEANGHSTVIEIDSRQMFAAGHVFYILDSGNYMTDKIKSQFVKNIRSNYNGT
jgi:RNA:NAD 2'-phosphotransferase (TPT1/KptA family)